ncbi:MAG: hypothetical protein UW79_C0036G0001, partial [Candidatus Yanofskybacteria bacterium GW2011_GWA2_44_9]
KPHALPEYLEGRTPKEKHPFLFQKKSGARKIRNARSVFSFGVAGVLASAWGLLRIICFENRFELGTINTPMNNHGLTAVVVHFNTVGGEKPLFSRGGDDSFLTRSPLKVSYLL